MIKITKNKEILHSCAGLVWQLFLAVSFLILFTLSAAAQVNVTKQIEGGGSNTIVYGDPVVFEIIVENQGAAAVTNFNLTDQLPTGIELLDASNNNAVVDTSDASLNTGNTNRFASYGLFNPANLPSATDGNVTFNTFNDEVFWDISSIAAGATVTLRIPAYISANYPLGTTATNTIDSVTFDGSNVNAAVGDFSEAISVPTATNLALSNGLGGTCSLGTPGLINFTDASGSFAFTGGTITAVNTATGTNAQNITSATEANTNNNLAHFDSNEFTMLTYAPSAAVTGSRAGRVGTNWSDADGELEDLDAVHTTTFSGGNVQEVYLSINSTDQWDFSLLRSENPDATIDILSGSDDAWSVGSGDEVRIINGSRQDIDTSGANDRADGNTGSSADFTLRFSATNPNQPLTFIRWRAKETPTVVRAARNDGWALALEVCAVFPTEEINVSKSASVGVLQSDGTYDVTYTITVANTGTEDLNTITLRDTLNATDQLSGAFDSIVTSPTVALATGSTASTLPAENPTYNGTTIVDLFDGSAATLVSGEAFVVTFVAKIDPNAANQPTTLQNQAIATALPPGGTAGDEITDFSDTDTTPTGGTDTTTNNPNETTGVPTVVQTPAPSPSLSLEKMASVSTAEAGDVITYTYTLENNGSVVINNATVTDAHAGQGLLSGITFTGFTVATNGSLNPGNDVLIDTFEPGDIATFSSTYQVTGFDILDGPTVTNLATGSGAPVSGMLTPVTADASVAVSDTPLAPVIPATCGGATAQGFLFSVADNYGGSNENPADFGSGVLNGNAGWDPEILYAQVARDAATGAVNFYTDAVDATVIQNTSVSDPVLLLTSDGLTSVDGPGNIGSAHQFEAWRMAVRLHGTPGATETLTLATQGVHEFSAFWQTDVTGAVINSALDSSSATGEDNGWLFGTGSRDGANFSVDVTYPLDGVVILNVAMLDPSAIFGSFTIPGYTCPNPELSVLKTSTGVPANPQDGDQVTYTFVVTNEGNVAIENVVPVEAGVTVNGVAGTGALSGFSIVTEAGFISTDVGSDNIVDNLDPGQAAKFTAIYTLTAADITAMDSASNPLVAVANSATATGDPERGILPEVTPSITRSGFDSTPPVPSLRLTKFVGSIVDDNNNGVVDAGDIINWTFRVENNGELPITGITVTDDTATVSSTTSASSIDLNPGNSDSTTFVASYVIDDDDVIAGGVENSATVRGTGSNGAAVSDISDTGAGTEATNDDDLGEAGDTNGTGADDGDPTNDPTVVVIDPIGSIELVKSITGYNDVNNNGIVDEGDTVEYTFTATNTGSTALDDVTLTDPGLATMVVTSDPNFDGNLAIGEGPVIIATGVYPLTDTDILNLGVESTAEVEAQPINSDANGNPIPGSTATLGDGTPLGTVTDTSDAGTEPTLNETTGLPDAVGDPSMAETEDLNGNTDTIFGNDPTVFPIVQTPSIVLTKSVASVNDLDGDGLPGLNDEVVYSFTVTNNGNVDLADVDVTDMNGLVTGGTIDLDAGQTIVDAFEMVYTLTATDIVNQGVENTAIATGTAVDAANIPLVDPLTGNDLTTSDTSDAGTAPEIGATIVPPEVTDPETTLTDDLAGENDGETGNDPTVLLLPNPQLTLVKSVSTVLDTNGDGVFGGVGDEITYAFTVTNTGNVDLIGITLTDLTATVTGGSIDLAIGQGNSTAFEATYTVESTDIDRGYVQNTATASGAAVDSNATPINDLNGSPLIATDISDTGTEPSQISIDDPGDTETPDGEGNIDSDMGNDPTVVSVPAGPLPSINLIKSVASVTDNGNGLLGAGDTITYSFVVTNTGNVALQGVALSDANADLAGGPIDLPIGGANAVTFTATHVITAAEAAAGGVENTAIASGNAVNADGDPISDPNTGAQLTANDTSDTGTEPELSNSGAPTAVSDPGGTESPSLDGATDTDPTNDPTTLVLPAPSIQLVKSVASVTDSNGDGVFGGVGDLVNYTFVVTNTGNVTLANITVSDPTADISGGPITLDPTESNATAFTATYLVTATDISRGYVENTATATGDALNSDGTPLEDPFNPGTQLSATDVSDTGTDATATPIANPGGTETPDGTGDTDTDPGNDPTVVNVPTVPEPSIALLKSVTNVVDSNSDEVLGGADDLVTYQFDVTNDGNTNLIDVSIDDPVLGGVIGTIASLQVGQTVSLTTSYTITDADQDAGFVENTATATGVSVNGSGTPLVDPNTGEQITVTDVSDAGTDRTAETVSDPTGTETPTGTGTTDNDPSNDPTVLNVPLSAPNTALTGVVFLDLDENGVFGPGDTLLPNVTVILRDADGNVVGTTTTDDNGFYSFVGFPTGTFSTEYIDPSTGVIVATIGGLIVQEGMTLTDVDQPLLITPTDGTLALTKTTTSSLVVLGDAVPYVITVRNQSDEAVTANLVDRMPIGFVYEVNSATIDGTLIEPSVSGTTLIWESVTLDAGQTATLEMVARVGPGTPTGELINTISALDPTSGAPLAVPASAEVRRDVEAIFDCSDVIGKVFDDRNFDGYQNSANRDGVSNQNVFGGKNKLVIVPKEEKEEGLPRVRLVTPTGTIITTDEHGRYSVPCAELPRDMGTNFTLKLDTRSLPTGFRVTTENPRTMRLTAGIMTEMNFGAAIGRVIDIDLTSAAFDAEDKPVQRLLQGIEGILPQIASEPSVLRLSYFANGEDDKRIKRRLKALESFIEDRWEDVGQYRLIVESDIRAQR